MKFILKWRLRNSDSYLEKPFGNRRFAEVFAFPLLLRCEDALIMDEYTQVVATYADLTRAWKDYL